MVTLERLTPTKKPISPARRQPDSRIVSQRFSKVRV
jgi:hypothetical protein